MMNFFDHLESNLNSRLNQLSLSSSYQPTSATITILKKEEPAEMNMIDQTKGGVDLGQNMLAPGDDPSENCTPQGGNPCQNFSSANTDATTHDKSIAPTSLNSSTVSMSNPLPPLSTISKHKWPIFSGDSSSFIDWKAQFLAVLCASELAPLYDPLLDDLMCPTTRDDIMVYDVQLYSRLITALPPKSSFIGASEYRSKGLALWHAITQEHESTGSYSHLDHLSSSFYSSSLQRESSESVDAYWNRFYSLVRKIQLDRNAPNFSKDYIRRRFLTSLGAGFEFIVEDANNERLSPALLNYSDEELKCYLRKIHLNKSTPAANTVTVSAMGYVNAAVSQKKAQVLDEGIQICLATQDAKLDAITNMFITHTESLNKCIATLSQSKQRRLKYCWTHGENYSHKSDECKSPGTGHQIDATWKNRKNGSEKTVKKE